MIKHLIFDLDNTLYPETSQMNAGVGGRILGFAAKFYNLPLEEAAKVRREALKVHGTTLGWIKAGGFTDVEEYFAYVHPASEIEELDFDEKLSPFLDSLPQDKIILTNSPCEHAEHVLDFLQVRDRFHPTICDIRMNNFKGKPDPLSYQRALDLIGGTVQDTLFIDDYSVYVKGYAAIGGTAVMVGSDELDLDTEGLPGKIIRIQNLYQLPSVLQNL